MCVGVGVYFYSCAGCDPAAYHIVCRLTFDIIRSFVCACDSILSTLSQTSMSVTLTMAAVLKAASTQRGPFSAAVELGTHWPLME